MGTIQIFVMNAAVVLAMMLVAWLVSLRLRDTSIVDVFWGLGFVLVAGTTYVVSDGWELRKALISAITAVWGFRLALHIYLRGRDKGEDKRYAAWREEHGDAWPLRSLFTVFLLQGAILWFVSLPVQAAQLGGPEHLTWLDGLGALVWAIGLTIEVAADAQLLAFKRDPANRSRILASGLWRYSRHPNYFGDTVVWWGIWLVAASTPLGRWTVLSPLLMTWLLRRVSGVTLTEKMMTDRPGYAEYVKRTNAFVLWRPKGGPQG